MKKASENTSPRDGEEGKHIADVLMHEGDFRDNDSMGEVTRHQWSFPLLLMTAPVMRVV